MKESLFRAEVLAHQRIRHYGTISINTPVHYTIITIGVVVLMSLIILFLIFGQFSEKFIVKGYLESTKGIIRIYPQKNGVIAKSYVHLGDEVKKGQRLFLIDTSFEGKPPKNNGLAQLEKRRHWLTAELSYKQQQLRALESLLLKKFISEQAYHKEQAAILELKNNLSRLDMEILQYKQDKSFLIRAPSDGIIASVMYQAGQYTQLTKPLVKILPNHAKLIATLFIPIKQSGFLQPKNPVLIRYDAYPYEHFGTAKATVVGMSQSILTDSEEENPIRVGQPYYKATASLAKQGLTVYGAEKKIQQGMTFSAVIIGPKRTLWQWIFEPIYHFYGDVFS